MSPTASFFLDFRKAELYLYFVQDAKVCTVKTSPGESTLLHYVSISQPCFSVTDTNFFVLFSEDTHGFLNSGRGTT